MSTSNFNDLSSFEPEAILAAVPGEHPRAAATLALGREASQTGQLDVAAISQIANEIYSEGFPASSPFYVGALSQSAIPNSSEASPAALEVGSILNGSSIAQPSAATSVPPLNSVSSEAFQAPAALGVNTGNDLSAYKSVELDQLLRNIEIPYLNELNDVLGSGGQAQVFSAGSSQTPSLASTAKPVGTDHFYFLQAGDGGLDSKQLASSGFDKNPAFDVNSVRKDFPILRELVNGRPLVWFDNAATTQKPQVVIDRLAYFYQHENSNIHRAAHELAARATDAYEEARETVRRFINAPSVDNVIFVRGTTEAINLVAKTWGKKHLGEDDEIVISYLEHHANIVPWQMLCQETGAKLKVAPVDDCGQIILSEYQKLLTPRVKLVSFTQVSNALGTVTPAKEMIQMAHASGAKVLLDGAQSVSHMRTDVQDLNPDFFVFSGHKVFAPTGIGALYGKPDVLADMPAWQGGGNMIQDVTIEKAIYHEAPNKFEAGTGNIADAVGLGTALEYVERIGIENIARYEHELLVYATHAMSEVPGLHFIGTAKEKASVLSFKLDGFNSEEVGAALNQEGIAVRSGHHCAQPILRRFGVETTVRPSLAFYNTRAEVDLMVETLKRLVSNRVPSGL